jgi:hypothetical protein
MKLSEFVRETVSDKDWLLRHHWDGLPGDDGADFPVRRRRLLSLDAAGEVRALQNHLEQELYVDGELLSFVWPNGSLSESIPASLLTGSCCLSMLFG